MNVGASGGAVRPDLSLMQPGEAGLAAGDGASAATSQMAERVWNEIADGRPKAVKSAGVRAAFGLSRTADDRAVTGQDKMPVLLTRRSDVLALGLPGSNKTRDSEFRRHLINKQVDLVVLMPGTHPAAPEGRLNLAPQSQSKGKLTIYRQAGSSLHGSTSLQRWSGRATSSLTGRNHGLMARGFEVWSCPQATLPAGRSRRLYDVAMAMQRYQADHGPSKVLVMDGTDTLPAHLMAAAHALVEQQAASAGQGLDAEQLLRRGLAQLTPEAHSRLSSSCVKTLAGVATLAVANAPVAASRRGAVSSTAAGLSAAPASQSNRADGPQRRSVRRPAPARPDAPAASRAPSQPGSPVAAPAHLDTVGSGRPGFRTMTTLVEGPTLTFVPPPPPLPQTGQASPQATPGSRAAAAFPTPYATIRVADQVDSATMEAAEKLKPKQRPAPTAPGRAAASPLSTFSAPIGDVGQRSPAPLSTFSPPVGDAGLRRLPPLSTFSAPVGDRGVRRPSPPPPPVRAPDTALRDPSPTRPLLSGETDAPRPLPPSRPPAPAFFGEAEYNPELNPFDNGRSGLKHGSAANAHAFISRSPRLPRLPGIPSQETTIDELYATPTKRSMRADPGAGSRSAPRAGAGAAISRAFSRMGHAISHFFHGLLPRWLTRSGTAQA